MADRKTETVPTLEYEGAVFRFPWRDALRPLTDAERASLKAALQEAGEVTAPILLAEDSNDVLDGDNRLHLAKELGFALNDLPFATVRGLRAPEQKRERARSLNYDRRQFTAEELAARAQERRENVRRKRAQGQSPRKIAEEEGVSRAQVRRDLESGGPGGPPDDFTHPSQDGQDSPPATETNGPPETVTGRDGKQYPAAKPKAPPPAPDAPPAEPEPDPEEAGNLARARQAAVLLAYEEGLSVREAARKVDMPESTLRGLLKSRKDDLDAYVAEEHSRWPKDEVGQTVPYRLHPYWALRGPIAEACKRCKENTALAHRLCDLPEFAQHATRFGRQGLVDSKNLYQWFSRATPFAVCPLCQGEGCKPPEPPDPIRKATTHCRESGWMTEDEFRAWAKSVPAGDPLFEPCGACGEAGKGCKVCHGLGRVLKGV